MYRRIVYLFISFSFSYLVCNQIWLNYIMNDRHFGYITKSLKETLSGKHFLVFLKIARFNLSQGVVSLCDSAIVWYERVWGFIHNEKLHLRRTVKVKIPITDHFFRSSSFVFHFEWFKMLWECYLKF
jgi:hypothetical protein